MESILGPGRSFSSILLGALCLVLAANGQASAKSGGTTRAKPSRGAAPIAAAAPAESPAGTPKVDSAKVHKLYLDGEFPAAIAILEDNLKETRQYSHGDSVFIFKHLGVMYAAQYDTREKGKYYMHRLLTVEPTAKILDMYASDMIYMIFKNIQEEYEANRVQLGEMRQARANRDTSAASAASKDTMATARRTKEESVSSGSGSKWIWAGVATAALAAGFATYVLMNEEEPKPTVAEKKF